MRWIGPPFALLALSCAEPPMGTTPGTDRAGPPPLGGPPSPNEIAIAEGSPALSDAPPSGPGEPNTGPGGGAGQGCQMTPIWAEKGAKGDTRNVSGTLAYAGELGAPILLDVVDAVTLEVVWGFECRDLGAFTVAMPAKLGKVWMAAFLDNDQDGPSDADPKGRTPGEFTLDADRDGQHIELKPDTVIDGLAYGMPTIGDPPAGDGPAPSGDPDMPPPGDGPPSDAPGPSPGADGPPPGDPPPNP